MVILIVMITLFLLAYRYGSQRFTRLFIGFIAIYIVLNAIRSPLDLLDGRDIGDGFALSEITFIPEVIWVMAWCLIACSCLYLLYNKFTARR